MTLDQRITQRSEDWIAARTRRELHAVAASGLLTGPDLIDPVACYWRQRQVGPLRDHRLTHRARRGADPYERD